MKSQSYLTLLGVFCFAASSAFGGNEMGLSSETPEWRLMLGVDAGIASVSTSVANEASKSGFGGAGKLVFGYYRDTFSYDIAVGAAYNSVHRYDASGTKYQLDNSAVLIEIGARYRLINRIYVGPVVSFWAGTDISFRETLNAGSATNSDQSTAFLGGLQALYDVPSNSLRLQVGARAYTDITINSRQLWLVQGVVQIGLPFTSDSRPPKEKVAEDLEPAPTITKDSKAKAAPKSASVASASIIDLGRVQFATGSSKLTPEANAYLIAVGRELAVHPNDWKRLEVQGHTDNRGSEALNSRLSKARSASVKAALLKGGAGAARVVALGFGSSRPIDPENNQKAWTSNRRVEFNFLGKDPSEALQRGIASIKKDDED